MQNVTESRGTISKVSAKPVDPFVCLPIWIWKRREKLGNLTFAIYNLICKCQIPMLDDTNVLVEQEKWEKIKPTSCQ
jgi:hypothetical protein